ncbi:hypothetical protein D9M68_903630 [compost metagenome]
MQSVEQGDQQLGVGVFFIGELAGIVDLLCKLRMMKQGPQSAQGRGFHADGGAWLAGGEVAATAFLVPFLVAVPGLLFLFLVAEIGRSVEIGAGVLVVAAVALVSRMTGVVAGVVGKMFVVILAV